jgi:hypothetical protein
MLKLDPDPNLYYTDYKPDHVDLDPGQWSLVRIWIQSDQTLLPGPDLGFSSTDPSPDCNLP